MHQVRVLIGATFRGAESRCAEVRFLVHSFVGPVDMGHRFNCKHGQREIGAKKTCSGAAMSEWRKRGGLIA